MRVILTILPNGSGGHDGHTQLNDIWASSDGGFSWTQICHSAQWHCRQGHATVVLEDHIYVLGGFGGSSRFNDIWKSSDAGSYIISNNEKYSWRYVIISFTYLLLLLILLLSSFLFFH